MNHFNARELLKKVVNVKKKPYNKRLIVFCIKIKKVYYNNLMYKSRKLRRINSLILQKTVQNQSLRKFRMKTWQSSKKIELNVLESQKIINNVKKQDFMKMVIVSNTLISPKLTKPFDIYLYIK